LVIVPPFRFNAATENSPAVRSTVLGFAFGGMGFEARYPRSAYSNLSDVGPVRSSRFFVRSKLHSDELPAGEFKFLLITASANTAILDRFGGIYNNNINQNDKYAYKILQFDD